MNIQDLRNDRLILIEAITGSRAYGTSTPKSDTDIRGIYCQKNDDILGFNYMEQVSDKKNDIVFYEVKRFLELASKNNPNILELLYIPDEFIIQEHKVFGLIKEVRNQLLTKTCRHSFGGYAIGQIKKARGLNKKIVNPVDKERKTPLDFCYVVDKESHGVKSFKTWFELWLKDKLSHDFDLMGEISKLGISSIPHMRDMYMVFFGDDKNYRGIIKNESSNDIRLSSIPKGEMPITTMHYNKDGYTKYCKDYKEYWDWVSNRNEDRYNDNMTHGKGYDSKNMMHCHRLLDMAIEIGQGKGVIVNRPNREELLKIRSGEVDYNQLVESAEEKVILMDEIFDNTSLPDRINKELINDLLITIRKKFNK